MKKLLALVLAMVMTLGLATVGASAATVKYADKNDIDYQEAADVLSTVGVFEGKGENFAPKDNLNRAEAAKLIAYLMLGNKTAEAIKGNGNRFSDVPADHWACGYIEYLATAGVVSGVGDNKFNPNGQVTAVQFAKMLNVALGYDAQVEGYVGESWNINIMKQANDDKIFDALEIGSNDVLTREQAAQMCLNALKADVVEYESKGDTLTINNSTVVLNAKKAKDKISNDSGKATKVKNDPVVGGYTLQLGEDRYNGDLEMVETRDDFGRPASEWRYKTDKIGTYVKRGDIKHTYTDEVKRGPLYDMLGKAIYDDLVDNKALLYYFEDGVPFDGNLGLVNEFSSKPANKTAIEKFVQKNGDQAICYGVGLNAANAGSTGNGTLTEVFVNDDHNVITISVINTYAYKASSDYRASTEDIVIAPVETAKINLDSTRLTLEDFPEIKDMKKDDYILITAHQNTNSNNYEAKSAAKAELLTAKVDKYIYDDNVTLDGNVTKYSKKAAGDSKITEYSVGQETTVVLDKYGYIIYVDEAVVSNNYVFISELYQGNGANTSKVKANAYFLDGTNSEITIKEISNLSSLSKSDMATKTGDLGGTIGVVANDRYAGWYTYNKNSSSEYTLNKVPSTRAVSGFTSNNNTGNLTKSDAVMFLSNINTRLRADTTTNVNGSFYQLDGVANTTIKANDKTVMVVTYAENNDVDIYTGVKNLPDITLAAAANGKNAGEGTVFVVSDSTNHYAKYVFVSLQGNWSVYGTENESLLYIIKTDKKNVASSDTTYYTYKALDENAKEIKIEGDGSNVFGSATYTAFYKTSKNADGRYTRGSEVPDSDPVNNSLAKYINKTNMSSATAGYSITADNGALTIAGDSFTLDNNYKLVVVSKANALNKLKDTDYEASVVTADSLAAMVKGYDVNYNVQAKLKDNYMGSPNGGKIIEAYVTINSAVANANSANGNNTASSASGIVAIVLPEELRRGGAWNDDGANNGATTYAANDVNATAYVASGSTNPSASAVETALDQELAAYGLTVSSKNIVPNYYVYHITSLLNDDDVYPDLIFKSTAETATAYDNSTYTISSAGAIANSLVVPAGKDLTIDASGTVTVNGDLIVAGNLTIKSGSTLTVNAAKRYDVLKSGHIYVNGTFNAANTGATVPNVIDGHSIELNTSSTSDLGTVEVIGNLNVTKGSVTATSITIQNGAEMKIADAGNLTGTPTVNNNGKVVLGDNAGVATGIIISGTVVDESGASATAAAKKVVGITLNQNLTNNTEVTITATGVSGTNFGAYNVDADTVVFTIKNVSNGSLDLTASGYTGLTGWTASFGKELGANGTFTLSKNESVNLTLTQGSNPTSPVSISLGKTQTNTQNPPQGA